MPELGIWFLKRNHFSPSLLFSNAFFVQVLDMQIILDDLVPGLPLAAEPSALEASEYLRINQLLAFRAQKSYRVIWLLRRVFQVLFSL